MSVVGPGGVPFVPLTGATAGASGQQKVAGANQQQVEAAQRKFAADLNAAATGDVDESTESGDRDADGRQPWAQTERAGTGGPLSPLDGPRPKDAEGDRGSSLDLDA